MAGRTSKKLQAHIDAEAKFIKTNVPDDDCGRFTFSWLGVEWRLNNDHARDLTGMLDKMDDLDMLLFLCDCNADYYMAATDLFREHFKIVPMTNTAKNEGV